MAVRVTKYGQDKRPPCDVLLHYSFRSTEARKGDGARKPDNVRVSELDMKLARVGRQLSLQSADLRETCFDAKIDTLASRHALWSLEVMTPSQFPSIIL